MKYPTTTGQSSETDPLICINLNPLNVQVVVGGGGLDIYHIFEFNVIGEDVWSDREWCCDNQIPGGDSDMLYNLDNTAVLCWLPAKTCFPPQHLKRFSLQEARFVFEVWRILSHFPYSTHAATAGGCHSPERGWDFSRFFPRQIKWTPPYCHLYLFDLST